MNAALGYRDDDRRPEEWARQIVFVRRTQAYTDFVKQHGRKPGEGVSRQQAKFEREGKFKKMLTVRTPWEVGRARQDDVAASAMGGWACKNRGYFPANTGFNWGTP